MFNPTNDTRLRLFDISADGGKTWTQQFLKFSEMKTYAERYKLTFKYCVTQRCESCGALFHVEYHNDGSYTYCNDVCDCEEADFHPYYPGEPTLSEFKKFFGKTASRAETPEITVVVKDGRVEAIYSTGQCISVEVIDLDTQEPDEYDSLMENVREAQDNQYLVY